MKNEWQFSEKTGSGRIETDKKTATITKLTDNRWRWAVYDKIKKPLAKRDGWWGICATVEDAMKRVEKELK